MEGSPRASLLQRLTEPSTLTPQVQFNPELLEANLPDDGRRDSVLSSLADSVATGVAVGVVPAPVSFLPELSDAGLVGASVDSLPELATARMAGVSVGTVTVRESVAPGPSGVRYHRSRRPLREATSFTPRIYGRPRPNS